MGKRRRAVVALSLLVAVLLVGCGQAASPSQPGGSVSASPDPTSSGSASLPPPTGIPTITSSIGGTKGPGTMTIRGVIEEGVEAGCLILKADDGKSYLLLGGDRALITSGGRLEAVGEPQPDIMTTCQQGTPFSVTQLRRI